MGDGLAWRIGDGTKVCIGADLWPGSDGIHILAPKLIQSLHDHGFFHLNQVVDPARTTIWSQAWYDANQLDLEGDLVLQWTTYTRALQAKHIHIVDHDDELIWQFSPFGRHSPKLGYIHLNT